jgi:hypothetical protein
MPTSPRNTSLLSQLRKAVSWAPNVAEYPNSPKEYEVLLETLIYSASQKELSGFTEPKT